MMLSVVVLYGWLGFTSLAPSRTALHPFTGAGSRSSSVWIPSCPFPEQESCDTVVFATKPELAFPPPFTRGASAAADRLH